MNNKKKVVYNTCYGGFSISEEALKLLNQKSNNRYKKTDIYLIQRDDPLLISVVEELGEKANGKCANLKIVDIPEEYINCYEIDEYDGLEKIICDPGKLILQYLSETNIDKLSDVECRQFLNKLKVISQE